MAQWLVPVLLLATLLVTSECVPKKRENQYEINVRHGPYEIHQRHVNTKPFKRTNPDDEGAMDQLGYRKEASLSEEVVTEQQPKKEVPRKYDDKSVSKGSKVRGSSVYRGHKKARHSWGYTANYGQSEFVTTTIRPQSFQKYGQRKKKARRPHHSTYLDDEDVEFKTLLSSERTQMEELAEKELMAGMKNFPFEKHIYSDEKFKSSKSSKHLKNHNMDENYFQRTTKPTPESRFVTPTVLYNNPQLRVPFSKEKKGPVKFPSAAKTTPKPITSLPVMTTQKPRKFQLPSSREDEEKDDKDEIYLLVKYEKPKAGGKPKANILEIESEIAKPAANRGRTRYSSQKEEPASSEFEDMQRNLKQNTVEVTTSGYSVSENLGSGEQLNQAPTPQPLLGTTVDGGQQGVLKTGNIGPNQSGVTPGIPVQQDRLAQKYLQLQQNRQNQQVSTTQQPVQQNAQNTVEAVTPASLQPIGPTQAAPPSPWIQSSPPSLEQNFPSQPNLQSIWSQNQQSFQNIQNNQLNQQNLQNQNLFFQTLQNQQTNLLNRNRMVEALTRQARPNQPFFNQPNLPTFPNFPSGPAFSSSPSFPSQNLDFTSPMGNPMGIPPMNQHIYPQTFFNQPSSTFPHNALNQHVFLGQSHNFINSPQHQFTRSLMNSLSSANHLSPQAFLNQLGHSWNKPESLHKPLNFQSLSQDFDNLIAKTKESQKSQNSNKITANSEQSQPTNPQSFIEQSQSTTESPPRSFQSFDFESQNKISNKDRGSGKFTGNAQSQNQQTRPQTFLKQNDEQNTQSFGSAQSVHNQNNDNDTPNFGIRNIQLNAANSPAGPENTQNVQQQSPLDQTGPQQFPTDSQNVQNAQISTNQQQQNQEEEQPNIPPNFLIPDHIRKIPPNQGMQQTVHQPDGLMVQHNAIRIQHQVVNQQTQSPSSELKLTDQGDTRIQLDRSAKGSVEDPAGNSLQQDSRSSEREEYRGTTGLRDSYGDFVGEEFSDFGEGARRPDTECTEEEEEASLEELSETTDPLELSRMLVQRNGGLTVEQFNKLFREYFDKDLTESDVHNLDDGSGTSGRSAAIDGNEQSPTITKESNGLQEQGGEAEGDLPESFETDDQENIKVQINKAGGRHEPIVKIGYGSSKSHQGVYKSPKFFEKLKESSVEDDWAPPEHLQEIVPGGELDGGEFEFGGESEQQEQSVSGAPEQQLENRVSEYPSNSGHQGGRSYIKFEKFN